MKKTPIFFLITIFSVGIFAKVNLAQMLTCAVKINVKSEDGILVKGTTATATNYETKEVYKAVLKNGMPFFLRLTKGGYEFSISKAGFKKSIGGIPVVCESESDILEAQVSKGNSKEIFDITRRPKTVIGPPVDSAIGLNTGDLREIAKSKGILNFDAVYLEKPKYPAAARYAKASGVVYVQVIIDEKGNVESAKAIEGHPLLYQACEEAAKKAKFKPTLAQGNPVKISGKIIYNFVL